MNSLLLIIVSIILPGIEPFLPAGSPGLAWAAVLGTAKPRWQGLALVLITGLVRDVVLTNRPLGISGVITTLIWSISVFFSTRFNRPALVAIASGILSEIISGAITHQLRFLGIVITALLTAIIIGILAIISDRNQGIKLRSV